MHGRCLLRPYREVICVRRESFLQSLYYFLIFEIEHSAISCKKCAVYLCLSTFECFGRYYLAKNIFGDIPQFLVMFSKQQNNACRLRIERTGHMFYSEVDDLFDLLICYRRLIRNRIIGASMFERFFKTLAHNVIDNSYLIVCESI